MPDLSIPENVVLWAKLEAAKRRVLYGVEELGLPVGRDGASLPLTFAFKSEAMEPVSTGHLNGCITICLQEADDVEREKARVEFGEPQRTLVGHFRHELGHYYWDLLVKPHQLEVFRQTFGNESDPSYEEAQQRHYSEGPARDWQASHISAYASMHPWEDFAESFAAYLDMAAVLGTAQHFDLITCDLSDFDSMIESYARIGIAANELNRDIGLLDLVPELFTPAVVAKLKFIHGLREKRDDSGRSS